MPETVTACHKCEGTNIEHDSMTLVIGQEGSLPKQIIVSRCVDCGEEEHSVSS